MPVGQQEVNSSLSGSLGIHFLKFNVSSCSTVPDVLHHRDTVVSVQQETEKLDVCVIVFFVHTEEESDEDQ